jgi:hypothetical protein
MSTGLGVQQLLLITSLTPSNASIFPEYILPNTRPFSTDPELLPRETYALCISFLAQTAKRFAEMGEGMKEATQAASGGAGGGEGMGEFEQGGGREVRWLFRFRLIPQSRRRKS